MKPSDTLLNLLDQAIDIGNWLAISNLREIVSDESHFRQQVVSQLGYLRAVEALLTQATPTFIEQNQASDDPDLLEIRKVERRLKLWCKRPDQINSFILSCYLRIRCEEGAESVSLDRLRERYISERCSLTGRVPSSSDSREFDTNFDQMKIIADRNHGKVFEVDSKGYVTIWKKVHFAVEQFQKEMGLS
jgi:hypothetical protein